MSIPEGTSTPIDKEVKRLAGLISPDMLSGIDPKMGGPQRFGRGLINFFEIIGIGVKRFFTGNFMRNETIVNKLDNLDNKQLKTIDDTFWNSIKDNFEQTSPLLAQINSIEQRVNKVAAGALGKVKEEEGEVEGEVGAPTGVQDHGLEGIILESPEAFGGGAVGGGGKLPEVPKMPEASVKDGKGAVGEGAPINFAEQIERKASERKKAPEMPAQPLKYEKGHVKPKLDDLEAGRLRLRKIGPVEPKSHMPTRNVFESFRGTEESRIPDIKTQLSNLSKIKTTHTLDGSLDSLHPILEVVSAIASGGSLEGVDTQPLFDAIEKWKTNATGVIDFQKSVLTKENKEVEQSKPQEAPYTGVSSEDVGKWEKEVQAPFVEKVVGFVDGQSALYEALVGMSDSLKDSPALASLRSKLDEAAHDIDVKRGSFSEYGNAKALFNAQVGLCSEIRSLKVELKYALAGVRRYQELIERFTKLPFVEKDDMDEFVSGLKGFEAWNTRMTAEIKARGQELAQQLSKATKEEDKQKLRLEILKLGLFEKQAYQHLQECAEKLKDAATLPGVGKRLNLQTGFISARCEEIKKCHTDLVGQVIAVKYEGGKRVLESVKNAEKAFQESVLQANPLVDFSADPNVLKGLKGMVKSYSRMFIPSRDQTETMQSSFNILLNHDIPTLKAKREEIQKGLKANPNDKTLLQRKEQLLKTTKEMSDFLMASHKVLEASGAPTELTNKILEAAGSVDAELASLKTGKTYKSPSLLKLTLFAAGLGTIVYAGTAYGGLLQTGGGGGLQVGDQATSPGDSITPVPTPLPSNDFVNINASSLNNLMSYIYDEPAPVAIWRPDMTTMCEMLQDTKVEELLPEIPVIETGNVSVANITLGGNATAITELESEPTHAQRIAAGEEVPMPSGPPSQTPAASPPRDSLEKTTGSPKDLMKKANMLGNTWASPADVARVYRGAFDAAKEQLSSTNTQNKAEAQEVLVNFVKKGMYVKDILEIDSPDIFPAWVAASKNYVHSPGNTAIKYGALSYPVAAAAGLAAPLFAPITMPVIMLGGAGWGYFSGESAHGTYGPAYSLAQQELISSSGRFEPEQIQQIRDILGL